MKLQLQLQKAFSHLPYRHHLRRWLHVYAPVALVVGMSLAGITNSNIGISSLRQDASQPHGVQIGTPQTIRSDEYLTQSPITLGRITAGPEGVTNPLSVPPDFFHQIPAGPISGLVFFDGSALLLGPWVPDAVLFAWRWWLPTLLLLLGLPAWFRAVTGRRRWGYVACCLTLFAPATLWWSAWPINCLGYMFAAGALILDAPRRLENGQRTLGVLQLIAAGILMARFPSYYAPYQVVLGFPILGATVAVLLAGAYARRTKIVALAISGITGAVLTLGLILENLDAITAGFATVYPGQRVSTGEHQPLAKIFGATNLGFLARTQSSLTETNASELSTAFTFLFLVALILRITSRWRADRATSWAWGIFAASTCFWLAWCTLPFGDLGRHLPIINLVPAMRSANVVGYLATIAFCLFMSKWRSTSLTPAALAALISGGITLVAGQGLRQVMPTLDWPMIVVATTLTSLCVFVMTRWSHRTPALIFGCAGAVALTITATPLEIGLADLRTSSTAQFMIREADRSREDGDLWASDSVSFDALMFATATPALSSRQQLGPERSEWLKLDPGGRHESVWNRGGTYIRFKWRNQPGISWSNPTRDQIVMTASPCTVADRVPALKYVVSTKRLHNPCLDRKRKLEWAGQRDFVYTIS